MLTPALFLHEASSVMTTQSSVSAEHGQDSYSFLSFQSIEPIQLFAPQEKNISHAQQGITPSTTSREEVIAPSGEKCGAESSKVHELQDEEHPYNWPWKIKGSMIITITLLNLIAYDESKQRTCV